MARISSVRISNYRSISDPIEIAFPKDTPVTLLGENNSGKSNIVRAIQLALGPFWPGRHEPEDNEFFERDRANVIEITIAFGPGEALGGRYTDITWRYTSGAADPVYFKGRPGQYGPDGYVSNVDRDTCACILLEADRNLDYHLSYSSKWTFLSRLMHKFHKVLSTQTGKKQELEDLFAHIKQKFSEIPEFATFLNELKGQFRDLVTSMTHSLEVDFEAYNPVNFFHALRLEAVEGNRPITLSEMGTGEQQVLALAFAHAYAKAFHSGLLLIMEEPEAHLHPLAQLWLAKKLSVMSRDGLQIVLTTHSPSFLNIEHLEGLVLVRKDAGSTKVAQLRRQDLVDHCVATGVPAARISIDNVLPFYSANASRGVMEGFFAKVVTLVEGPTESLALPVWFRKCGLDVERLGVAIVPVHGKGNLGKWRRLFGAYGIPCYTIFDNDASDDPDSTNRRDVLKSVGVQEHLYDEVVRAEEWKVSDEYTVFGTNFERTLRGHFGEYSTVEDEARQLGIDSKPFLARWVAERIEKRGQSGWAYFERMSNAIRRKLVVDEN